MSSVSIYFLNKLYQNKNSLAEFSFQPKSTPLTYFPAPFSSLSISKIPLFNAHHILITLSYARESISNCPPVCSRVSFMTFWGALKANTRVQQLAAGERRLLCPFLATIRRQNGCFPKQFFYPIFPTFHSSWKIFAVVVLACQTKLFLNIQKSDTKNSKKCIAKS